MGMNKTRMENSNPKLHLFFLLQRPLLRWLDVSAKPIVHPRDAHVRLMILPVQNSVVVAPTARMMMTLKIFCLMKMICEGVRSTN
jgi:hypothetical protein